MSLIAVIDESGTNNVPTLGDGSSFVVSAILFNENELDSLVKSSKQICGITKASDFKYKHVQVNTDARAAFLRAIRGLSRPSGLLGFYAPGPALLKEKKRVINEIKRLDSDDGGDAARTSAAIESGNIDLLLESFMGFLSPMFLHYASFIGQPIRVFWDRRTDIERIVKYCSRNEYLHKLFIGGEAENTSLEFCGEATGDLKHVAKLSGVVAGDVSTFFRRHGPRIWPRLRALLEVNATAMSRDFINGCRLDEHTLIDTVYERLADGNFMIGNRDTCILQGYTKHFVRGLLSFASPEGIMGHIEIVHGSQWRIHQFPD